MHLGDGEPNHFGIDGLGIWAIGDLSVQAFTCLCAEELMHLGSWAFKLLSTQVL